MFPTLQAISQHVCFLTSVCKTLNYFLLLCFCFKNIDLFDLQTTQFDFSLSTMFVIFTSCGLKLCVKSLNPKQYVVPSSFPFLLVLFLTVCFSCFTLSIFYCYFSKLLVIWLVVEFFIFFIFNSLFLFFDSFIWVSSFFSFSFSSFISASFPFSNFSLFDWVM